MEMRSFTIILLVLCSCNKCVVVGSLEKEQLNHRGEHKLTRHNIATAQYQCFQRILKQAQHRNKTAGPVCNMTWDAWLCWEETEAGKTAEQNCPDYYEDFDPNAIATKVCSETGQWGRHPLSNRTWTNFTNCKANPAHMEGRAKLQEAAMTHFYLVMIGHGLSLISLLVSLAIFFHFKSLSCQRITLHKNLFISCVLNSIITVVQLTTLAKNEGHSDSVSCKLLMFVHLYLLSCNYFWMLCEGIYLHTLIVVAVFAEKQHLVWYYLLGWGFPLIPAVIHSIARRCYYNDKYMLGQLAHVATVYYPWTHLCSSGGELVLPAEHRAGADHKAAGDPPGRVQPVHEGSEGHPDPHPSAGHPVRAAALQAPGAARGRSLPLRHGGPHALPGSTSLHNLLLLQRRGPERPAEALEPAEDAVSRDFRQRRLLQICVVRGLVPDRGAPLLQHREPHGDHQLEKLLGHLQVRQSFCVRKNQEEPGKPSGKPPGKTVIFMEASTDLCGILWHWCGHGKRGKYTVEMDTDL